MTVTSTYGVYLAEQDSFRYQMFEINMDEYLDDEIESVKLAFEAICKEWDKQVSHLPLYPRLSLSLSTSHLRP